MCMQVIGMIAVRTNDNDDDDVVVDGDENGNDDISIRRWRDALRCRVITWGWGEGTLENREIMDNG